MHAESSPNPKYSLRERLAPEKSSDRIRTILSPQITAMIDPKEFHAIKLDLLKTTVLAIIAFMTELWLYVRLGQK